MYIRNKPSKGGRPRSALTVKTDEETMRQIIKVLGDVLECDVDTDMLQQYFNGLAARGASASVIRKRWIILNMFFNKVRTGDNPLCKCEKPQAQKKDTKWTVDDDDDETLAYTPKEMGHLAKTLSVSTGTLAAERGRLLVVIMYEFIRLAEGVELRVKEFFYHLQIINADVKRNPVRSNCIQAVLSNCG